MSAYLSRLLQIKDILSASRNTRWVQIPPPGPDTVVLFQRRPPLWARWSHLLVALDVMLITSIVEYTWDIGGFFHAPAKIETPSKGTAENESDKLPLQIAQQLQMQPVWKKALFSGMYIISGVIFGGALLAARARLLRNVTVHKGNPRTRTPTTFYLQSASQPRRSAFAFPSDECRIVQGDIPSRLLLRVQNQGAWTMNLSGAEIHKQAGYKKDEIPRTGMIRAWRDVGGRIEASDATK